MAARTSGLVVLVHGAWHDGWCWNQVGERLSAQGVDWVAPDLPMSSYAGDVAVVRAAIADPERPHLVVGHSRGGVIASFATAGQSQVKQLVYLTAPMLPEGLAKLPQRRETLREGMVHDVDGHYIVDPARAIEMLYADCDADVAATAVARLRPTASHDAESIRGLGVGWRSIPSTYVVCTEDRCIHPDDQRLMANNADEVIEIPTGHSPQLARPELVAELLLERVVRAGLAFP